MDLTPIVAESIVKKSEGLLTKLFGPALSEIGENLADKIKYRRFKNQVETFAKASELLESKGITAKPIALKHLATLIDLSSLEEHPKIQKKWAGMIANLASYDSLEIFNQQCVSLLNSLSPEEIVVLDYLNDEFVNQRGEVIERREERLVMIDYREVFTEDISFDPWEVGEKLNIDTFRIKLYIENMVALGLLHYEEMELEDNELIKSFDIHLSYLGLYFVRLCKYY